MFGEGFEDRWYVKVPLLNDTGSLGLLTSRVGSTGSGWLGLREIGP